MLSLHFPSSLELTVTAGRAVGLLALLAGAALAQAALKALGDEHHRSLRRTSELTNLHVFQEGTIVGVPEIGDQHERYKIRVPCGIIPYIWRMLVENYRYESG